MSKSGMIGNAAAMIPTVLSGCATSLHMSPVGRPEPVTNWPNVNNVFRDGKVYFAGQPTVEALREAPERGIKQVVNLRTAPEMTGVSGFDEAAVVADLGMAYTTIPITPASLSYTDADRLKEILDKTSDPVMLHCGSSNRVGALWALYLHRYRGFDLDEAIRRGQDAGLRSPTLIEAIKRIAREMPPAG